MIHLFYLFSVFRISLAYAFFTYTRDPKQVLHKQIISYNNNSVWGYTRDSSNYNKTWAYKWDLSYNIQSSTKMIHLNEKFWQALTSPKLISFWI